MPNPRLPWLHAPVRHPLVVVDDRSPRHDPPMPATDPLRATRAVPLSESDLEYLRRMARGPVRHNTSPVVYR